MNPWLAPLRRDLPTRLTAVAFVAVSALYFLPLPKLWELLTLGLAPALFQLLVLFALEHGRRRLEEASERRFWRDITIAHGSWWIAGLLRFFTPKTQQIMLAVDLLYCVYYISLVLAVERRAHRADDWRPAKLERALVLPSATLFVTGLLVYFVLVESFDVYNSYNLSYFLYVSLDLYIAGTFLYLSRTSYSPRWRHLYTGLGIAYGMILGLDLMESALDHFAGRSSWGSPLDIVWNLPLAFLVLAVRQRHQRFPPPDAEMVARAKAEDSLSGPSGRTMVTALAFPFLHFAYYNLFDPPAHRHTRSVLALVWMLLLATVAAVQYHFLRRRLQALHREREAFEASLQNSEQDLRLMVERSHGEQRVKASEQRFTKAFHASPDAMVLTQRDEGRILEVNASFEKITGRSREEIIGRYGRDLGIQSDAEAREQVLQQLDRDGRIRGLEIKGTEEGQEYRALLSIDPLEIDGERCLLAVFRLVDPASGPGAGEHLEFEELGLPAFCLDAEGHLLSWSRGAEELLGGSAEQYLGRPAAELDFLPGLELEGLRHELQRSGEQRTELVLRDAYGETHEAMGWWTLEQGGEERLVLFTRQRDTPPEDPGQTELLE